jgi:predicted DNA-binding protein
MKKDRTMTIRLPAEVLERLREQASKDTRTLADQILHYVKIGLEKNT